MWHLICVCAENMSTPCLTLSRVFGLVFPGCGDSALCEPGSDSWKKKNLIIAVKTET